MNVTGGDIVNALNRHRVGAFHDRELKVVVRQLGGHNGREGKRRGGTGIYECLGVDQEGDTLTVDRQDGFIIAIRIDGSAHGNRCRVTGQCARIDLHCLGHLGHRHGWGEQPDGRDIVGCQAGGVDSQDLGIGERFVPQPDVIDVPPEVVGRSVGSDACRRDAMGRHACGGPVRSRNRNTVRVELKRATVQCWIERDGHVHPRVQRDRDVALNGEPCAAVAGRELAGVGRAAVAPEGVGTPAGEDVVGGVGRAADPGAFGVSVCRHDCLAQIEVARTVKRCGLSDRPACIGLRPQEGPVVVSSRIVWIAV